MKRALRLPVAILTVLLIGTVGVMLFRAKANEKPHSVLLRWNPPAAKAGSTVTGYKIYRSLPGEGYRPIASVTAPTYVDHEVTSGTTYTYFVTAEDANGHESAPSIYVTVTVD